MRQMFVIGEDALCCALGTRLVEDVLGWTLAQPAVDTKGVTRLRGSLSRYANLTHVHPVLCLADTDGNCAAELSAAWLPREVPQEFLLRLAVTESESWLLADRQGLARFLDVAEARIPGNPEGLGDAKRTLLHLARQSRRRIIRQEVVSDRDMSKPGTGYNLHLRDFVMSGWSADRAAVSAPSLARAVRRLKELEAG